MINFIITLKKTEIHYDVDMITHVIGSRETAAGTPAEQAWNYSNTSDESGELNLINRFIGNAVDELVAALARYLKEEDVQESDNTLSDQVLEFKFNFEVPDNYNKTYIKPLRSSMHEFIINRVLFDWFLETKHDEAIKYEGKYRKALENAISFTNKRKGMIRLKPYPRI